MLDAYGLKAKNIELVVCKIGLGCVAPDLAREVGATVKAPLGNVNVLEGIVGVSQVRDGVAGLLRKPGGLVRAFKPGKK